MFIVFVLEVPKTTPRMDDSLENSTGLSISSYLELTFITKKEYKQNQQRKKAYGVKLEAWCKPGICFHESSPRRMYLILPAAHVKYDLPGKLTQA